MDKAMTINEAWDDFDGWIAEPGRWQSLTAADRNKIMVARHAAAGKLVRNGKVIPIGIRRVKSLLEKYAPGRYRFETVIYLNSKFDIDDLIDPPECIEPGCPLYAGKLKSQKDWICPVCGIDIKWNISDT